MGQIGCLGDIIFMVSSETLLTIRDVEWGGSVRYTKHQRHLNNALTEFTGIDPDTFGFNIELLSELGVDVMEELVKIWTYERKAETLPLVIGEKGYGKFRWVIEKHRTKMQYFDSEGNLSGATVSLSLLEYIKV